MFVLILKVFITILLTSILHNYSDLDTPISETPQNKVKQKYDFIIVGAGLAGCALANRLSENPDWSILLIEAGPDETAYSKVPYMYPTLTNTGLDWNYTSIPQKRSCQAKGGLCAFTAGHVIGGSSSIGPMSYLRGNKDCYNYWAGLGNTGWSYKDVLPYFKKAENATPHRLATSPYHGTNGPINVQYPIYRTQLRKDYIKAGVQFGWKHADYNGEGQLGPVIDYWQTSMDGASRESAATAYLFPIKSRKNLNIIDQSLVVKILIDKYKKRAFGVEYVRNGEKCVVKAKKEVIVTAGTFGSAKLLMLSGIGPKYQLKGFGIQVQADLPVGSNLYSIIVVPLYFMIDKPVTITSNVWETKKSILEYTKYKKGPLTATGAEAVAYINPDDMAAPPSILYIMSSTYTTLNMTQNKQIIGISVCLVTPKSVGKMSLQSTDPNVPPLIDPNFFSDPNDIELTYKGVKIAIDYMMKTPSMQKYSPKLYKGATPNCQQCGKDKYIRCLISQYSTPFHRPAGTVKMGPADDETSVVTPDLLVKEFENLRVAGSVIMPVVVRGNGNAPASMIGEKLSDIIKQAYGYRQ